MASSDTEVLVHAIRNPKKFEIAYLLYSWPSMRLHEDASRWLSSLAAHSSLTHQRNVAYSLAYWHTYCLATGLDYCRASAGDLVDFKVALANVVSEKTKGPLAAGTIGQRLGAVISYYVAGEREGWNLTATDLDFALRPQGTAQNRTKGGGANVEPIGSAMRRLIPGEERAETDIRPLSTDELRTVLYELGPSEDQVDKCDLRPQRDRLIAEWLAYVGLRLSEVLGAEKKEGLSVNQIVELAPDPANPFDHCIVRVLGKFSKTRNVAVPNWLVLKTLAYIAGERAEAISHLDKPSKRLFVAGQRAGAAYRGKPISGRRYQKIFEEASMRASQRKTDGTRPANVRPHSPHDLRHTYAVMTYFAERELGNPEPWKVIQAQLGHKYLTTTVDTYLAYVSVLPQWGHDLRRMSVRELAGLRDGKE